MKKILKFMSVALVSSFLMSVGGNSVFAIDLEPDGFNPNNNQNNNEQHTGEMSVVFLLLSMLQRSSKTFCSEFDEYCLSKGWEVSDERTNSEQIDYFVGRLKIISENYGHRVEEYVLMHRNSGNQIVLERMQRNGEVTDITMFVRRSDTNAYINDNELFTVFGAFCERYYFADIVRLFH